MMSHYMKGTIHQKESTFLKSNNESSKYKKQNLRELHKKIDKFTTIVEKFNITLLVMGRWSRQKSS